MPPTLFATSHAHSNRRGLWTSRFTWAIVVRRKGSLSQIGANTCIFRLSTQSGHDVSPPSQSAHHKSGWTQHSPKIRLNLYIYRAGLDIPDCCSERSSQRPQYRLPQQQRPLPVSNAFPAPSPRGKNLAGYRIRLRKFPIQYSPQESPHYTPYFPKVVSVPPAVRQLHHQLPRQSFHPQTSPRSSQEAPFAVW